jgi:hypothetical protein
MIARGVFGENTKTRKAPPVPGAPTKPPAGRPMSQEQIRATLKEYLGPWLKA